MRLADLRPELKGTLEDGWLTFDCPTRGAKHRVRVPVARSCFNGRWAASGEFPDRLTLQPSIRETLTDHEDAVTICWHGHVTEGAITRCQDSQPLRDEVPE